MAELKNVEIVRQRLLRGFQNEIVKVRSWLSAPSLDNWELVDLLAGERGDALVAQLTDAALAHLGHAAGTQTRRLLSSARGRTTQGERSVNNRSEIKNAQ